MAIEHEYFGLIETDNGSISWSDVVELGDQNVTIDLSAPFEADVEPAALDAAAMLVRALEGMDIAARNAMVSELDSRASEVTEYILQQEDRLGDELEDFLVDISGDTPIDVIRSLELVSLTVLLDEFDGEEPFAILEYIIDVDAPEEALLVNFGSDGTIQSIASADR
jgi:hypothetical protein